MDLWDFLLTFGKIYAKGVPRGLGGSMGVPGRSLGVLGGPWGDLGDPKRGKVAPVAARMRFPRGVSISKFPEKWPSRGGGRGKGRVSPPRI